MQENNAENKIKNNLLKSFLVFLVIFTLSFSSIFIYKNFLNKTKADLSPNNSKELKNIEQNISEIEKPNENDIYKIKSENAKYTVVNYFSLDCIHCQRLWKFETQPENLNILKGEINLIYRPTSLFSQKLSGEKQLIGECLYKLSGNNAETFFDFVDNIYSGDEYINTQKDNEWIKLKAEKYVKREAFRSCIENIDNKNNINKIKTKHLLQGIKFTPTLFIFDSQNSLVKKYESVGGIVGWNIIKNLLK